MENDKCFKIFFPVGTAIGWLNNNKGTIKEYEWSLHRSFVELHVGGADQQELEQQVSAHQVKRVLYVIKFKSFVVIFILAFIQCHQ